MRRVPFASPIAAAFSTPLQPAGASSIGVGVRGFARRKTCEHRGRDFAKAMAKRRGY